MDLLELAPDAVKKATAAGAEQAEAFAMRYGTRHVYIEDDAPKVAEDRQEVGLGLRVAKGKRVSFASTTLAGVSDVAGVVRTAVQGLGPVPEDPDFAGFAVTGGKGAVPGVEDAAAADPGAGLRQATLTTENEGRSRFSRLRMEVEAGVSAVVNSLPAGVEGRFEKGGAAGARARSGGRADVHPRRSVECALTETPRAEAPSGALPAPATNSLFTDVIVATCIPSPLSRAATKSTSKRVSRS